jgi:hypothetical protein
MKVAGDALVMPEPASSPKFVAVPRSIGTFEPADLAKAVDTITTKTTAARTVIFVVFTVELLQDSLSIDIDDDTSRYDQGCLI